MHELGIAQSVIDTVERSLREQGERGRVVAVRVRVGRLTTVLPENLRFLYGVVAEGTSLRGSRLEVEEVPVRARCRACGAEFEVAIPCFLCSACSSGELELQSGNELSVSSVEIEEEKR